jgi:bifunctional DNA-binding transcriptional regulator/antitoxin component of YhaV-PrlF toxin-antitoxin module
MSMRRRATSARRREQDAKPRSAYEGIENRVCLKVDAAGRLLIPAEMRSAMGLSEDGAVLAWLDQGELRVVGTQVAAGRAQQLARTKLGPNPRLVDELIADRREEARREAENG